MQKPLFTTVEIDEGKLVVEVQDILGKPGEVLMHFPNWRERQMLWQNSPAAKASPAR